jgi:hypothetical protein
MSMTPSLRGHRHRSPTVQDIQEQNRSTWLLALGALVITISGALLQESVPLTDKTMRPDVTQADYSVQTSTVATQATEPMVVQQNHCRCTKMTPQAYASAEKNAWLLRQTEQDQPVF